MAGRSKSLSNIAQKFDRPKAKISLRAFQGVCLKVFVAVVALIVVGLYILKKNAVNMLAEAQEENEGLAKAAGQMEHDLTLITADLAKVKQETDEFVTTNPAKMDALEATIHAQDVVTQYLKQMPIASLTVGLPSNDGAATAQGRNVQLSRGPNVFPALHYVSHCELSWQSHPRHCNVVNAILESEEFHDYMGAPLIKLNAAQVDGTHVDFQIMDVSRWGRGDIDVDVLPTLVLHSLDEADIRHSQMLHHSNVVAFFSPLHYKNFIASGDTYAIGIKLMEFSTHYPKDSVPESLSEVMSYLNDHLKPADKNLFYLIDESQKDGNGIFLQSKIKHMPFQATWHSGNVNKYFKFVAAGSIDPSKPFADRTIDVFFKCSFYEGRSDSRTAAMRDHRKLALSQLQAMKRKFESDPIQFPYAVHLPTNRLDDEEFLKSMCDSKIIISPFGYGEWSIKDEIAAWCHTISLKPGLQWLDTGPTPLYSQSSDIDLKLDFSNLEEVVLGLLQNPDDLQRRSTDLGRAMDPYIGEDNLLRRPDVLEEFASVLRPFLVKPDAPAPHPEST